MKHVSYSQYTKWLNCPLGYQLKYIDGHRLDGGSIHTAFGTAVHETVQEWLDLLYNKSETFARTVYLHDTFKEKLLREFKEGITLDENGQKVFYSDKATLMEFYNQGCAMIDYIQENYKRFFPTEDTVLHSIEYPLRVEVIPDHVEFIGYIDVVTHNTETGEYKLYDLKTSTRGWNQWAKKDVKKIDQLRLYKRFFAIQEDVDENDITVEFTIMKRMIPENTDFHIPRVSSFVPSHKSPSIKKSWESFQNFINTVFTPDGEYVSPQVATPSKSACRFCEFNDRPDLCSFIDPEYRK